MDDGNLKEKFLFSLFQVKIKNKEGTQRVQAQGWHTFRLLETGSNTDCEYKDTSCVDLSPQSPSSASLTELLRRYIDNVVVYRSFRGTSTICRPVSCRDRSHRYVYGFETRIIFRRRVQTLIRGLPERPLFGRDEGTIYQPLTIVSNAMRVMIRRFNME